MGNPGDRRAARWLPSAMLLAFVGVQTASAASGSAPLARKLDAIFARYGSADTPGCAISVVQSQRVLLERAWGAADLEHGVRNAAGTIFEAGSVSKQFVAATILALVQEGRLSLSDDIRKFIPELPAYSSVITIDQLISHTSGLRDWGVIEEIAGWPRGTREYTMADVLDIASRQRELNYPSGTEFSYTNTGYNLLVLAAQRITGVPFPHLSQQKLFGPLAMHHTSWRDDFRRIVPGRAIAYDLSGDTWRQDMPFEDAYGNGGMLTTVQDLQRWNGALQSGRLGPFITSELQRRSLLSNAQPTEYARGLFIGEWRGVQEISHGGATAGYRTWLGRYPAQATSIALLCNAGDADTRELAHKVANLVLKDPGPKPTRPEETSAVIEPPFNGAVDLQGLVGRYRSDEADATYVFAIEADRGVLHIERRPGIRIPLVAIAADAFRGDQPGISGEEQYRIQFHRDGAGRVVDFGIATSRVRDLRFSRQP